MFAARCHGLQCSSTFRQIVVSGAWLLSLHEQLLNLVVKGRTEVESAICVPAKPTSIYCCRVVPSLHRVVRFNIPGQVVEHRRVDTDLCLFGTHLLTHLIWICGWASFCCVHNRDKESILLVLHICVLQVHLTIGSLETSSWCSCMVI